MLKCIHRHTIKDHPNCFREGKINYNFKNEKEFEKLVGLPWYDYTDENGDRLYRIGFFDIEVDNLKPDFGTVLTWAIKERGNPQAITRIITKEEMYDGTTDQRLISEFVSTIYDFDILVGYYSTKFDLPYMRSKALHYDMGFPGFTYIEQEDDSYKLSAELLHWDLYYTVKNKLRLSRNSLANATQYLGIKGKTPLDAGVWNKAKYGDYDSLQLILEHNIADVEITEKLWEKLIPFKKWTKTPA